MPESVRVHSPVDITAARLTAEAFAPFGDVIANPRPDVQPSPAAFALLARTGTDAVPANQGSAIKYRHVSRPRNLYGGGDGGARPEMNMFSCGARQLDGAGGGRGGGGTFPVSILERHPFTSQTFIPLATPGTGHTTATGNRDAQYLVIVAPSLPPSDADSHLPVPRPLEGGGGGGQDTRLAGGYPGRGLPDLGWLRAFVASARQAVTYGPGTWHAPMVALAPTDFVVFQFTSGVAIEDCQEVELQGPGRVSVRGPASRREAVQAVTAAVVALGSVVISRRS